MRHSLLVSVLALTTFACSAEVGDSLEPSGDDSSEEIRTADADERGSPEELVATAESQLSSDELQGILSATRAGGTISLKSVPGLTWGPSVSLAQAVKNAALITSFLSRTAKTDRVRSGLPSGTATVMIAPTGRFVAPLIRVGGNNSHDIDLRDVKIQLFQDVQPDTKNNGASLVEVNNQSDATHRWWLDGNCPKQHLVAGTWNNAGLYNHGLRFFDSDGVTLDARVDDICGVTGHSIKQTASHPEGPNETFHVQFLRGAKGGNNVTIRMANTGVAPTKRFSVQEGSSSGLVFQHWDGAGRTDPSLNRVSHVTGTISKLRHGIGGYQAGRVHVRGGTIVADCEHNLNFEVGSHDASHAWQQGALGYSVGDAGKYVVLDGRGGETSIQLQVNFNGDTLRSNLQVEGLVTIGGQSAFELDGLAKDGDSLADVPRRFDFRNSWFLDPSQYLVKLTGTASSLPAVASRISMASSRWSNNDTATLVTAGTLGVAPAAIP